MAIATVNDIISGLASARKISFAKTTGAFKAVGSFTSSWLNVGSPAAGSAAPAYNAGSGYACDKSTTGALPYQNAGVKNWLARYSMLVGQQVYCILADRLWSCSGMGFAASTYTVTTPGSLPARITDNGIGCELWVENFVAAGAATGTLTVNYLNTDGASKSAVLSPVVSAPVAGQMQQVPLAAGDLGIKQITSVVTSNTWTSGSFGMTIVKRLFDAPIGSQPVMSLETFDWTTCLTAIPQDACLFFILGSGSVTTTTYYSGQLTVIDK